MSDSIEEIQRKRRSITEELFEIEQKERELERSEGEIEDIFREDDSTFRSLEDVFQQGEMNYLIQDIGREMNYNKQEILYTIDEERQDLKRQKYSLEDQENDLYYEQKRQAEKEERRI